MIPIKKTSLKITPSVERTLIRPFIPGSLTHIKNILFRILSTPESEHKKTLDQVYKKFINQEDIIKSIFLKHYNIVKRHIPSDKELNSRIKEIIGAYFTQQYALESTALFNPSIVLHPIQDKKDITKFIISLRAIGEGHISSITFMEGEIDQANHVSLIPNSPVIYEPERTEHSYEKELFIRKIKELDLLTNLNKPIFDNLEDYFNLEELDKEIKKAEKMSPSISQNELHSAITDIRMLALSNFTLNFTTENISERAIYPASPSQSNGLEDARFVRFVEDDGTVIYYATFTAFNGKTIMPEMLETYDFKKFIVSTLNGPAVMNKGMALFPRKINGYYMMLGRQDNESLYIMTSDNPYFWHDYQPLIKPTHYWELMQIGNCGSPIEIDEGWLVITHGVGVIRTYSLGLLLLDKNEPWKVIGRLKEPFLQASKKERMGHVPNVLYTCGAMAIGRTLLLPYAIGDVVTSFALINIDDIINELRQES